jgi:hypothetical protein
MDPQSRSLVKQAHTSLPLANHLALLLRLDFTFLLPRQRPRPHAIPELGRTKLGRLSASMLRLGSTLLGLDRQNK